MLVPAQRVVIAAVLLAACRPEAVPTCQTEFQAFDDLSATHMLTLPEADGLGPVQVQLQVPLDGPRTDDGAPVVVFVHGGWANSHVPLERDSARIMSGHGLAALYLNLPGGTGEHATEGTSDRRGPAARAALAHVLRYAAGWIPDFQDCSISERVSGGTTTDLVLASFSNGGNLAWATLADTALDLPEVSGVASFETPSAGQFAVAETGTDARPSPIYEPGSCALDDDLGIVCDYAYPSLSFDALASPDTDGMLFVDEGGTEAYDDGVDFPLGLVADPVSGLWIHSVPATEAAATAGLALSGRGDVQDSQSFWADREAPRQMIAAAARFPGLAAIETGTETDHVLQGATDHPHVTGMVAAMQGAGLAWSRLHADAVYAEVVTEADRSFADHPADTLVAVGDTSLDMQPEDDDEVRGTDYLTAACLELVDRTITGDWSPDLDSPLVDR